LRGASITTATRLTYLRSVLIPTGIIYVAGIFPLTRLWPSGWSWGTGHAASFAFPVMVPRFRQ